MGKLIVIEGSCDGVGKSTQYKLLIDRLIKDKENVIRIIINNSMENKIKRATSFYGLDKNKAEKEPELHI